MKYMPTAFGHNCFPSQFAKVCFNVAEFNYCLACTVLHLAEFHQSTQQRVQLTPSIVHLGSCA
jgi:hypothetical protein